MTTPLLEVDQLHLTLVKDQNSFPILHGISFSIYPGEVVGLVGESGCGKSLTASAIMGLLPSCHTLKGRIIFEGEDLVNSSVKISHHPRGNRLSLILQDPGLALNPLIPIGKQLMEGVCYHKKISKQEAFKKSLQWLSRVGIGDAHARMKQYPHEISGGMKQRILIAMALICQPSFLIADEPTTALDVTVQAQVLDLLQFIQEEERMSMLLITHDLGIIANYCHRMLVMYAGHLVEEGFVKDIFQSPQHPYTKALLHSQRSLEQARNIPLKTLKGYPPSSLKLSSGCIFSSRCPSAMRICEQYPPPREKLTQGNLMCWLPEASRNNR